MSTPTGQTASESFSDVFTSDSDYYGFVQAHDDGSVTIYNKAGQYCHSHSAEEVEAIHAASIAARATKGGQSK